MHQTSQMELWAEVCSQIDLHMRGQKRFTSIRLRGQTELRWLQLEISQYCSKECILNKLKNISFHILRLFIMWFSGDGNRKDINIHWCDANNDSWNLADCGFETSDENVFQGQISTVGWSTLTGGIKPHWSEQRYHNSSSLWSPKEELLSKSAYF